MKSRIAAVSLVFLSLLATGLQPVAAASINVNFAIGTNDNNSVDANENSVIGNLDAVTVAGNRWNHVLLSGASGVPTTFITNTTGGNSLTLIDDSGANAATLTSNFAAGTGFANFSAASGVNAGATGDAGLMQSYLNLFGTSEVITVSGLGPAFTSNGYYVVAFFDIGDPDGTAGANTPRTYGLMIDGTTYFTTDTITDSDTNNDGIMGWIKTTSTTSGTAVTDANYAVFTGLTGSSFTITGVQASGGRATLNGFQIISVVPEPGTFSMLLFGGVMMWLLGRKRN